MSLRSLPTELLHLMLEELDAQAKLALTATNQYLRLLILAKHNIPTLTKTALLNLESRPPSSSSVSPVGWIKIRPGSSPCYTCLKILPRLHYGLGDLSHDNVGKRMCMTCCWAGKIGGTSKMFCFNDESWLYCGECKIVVPRPSSSLRMLRNSSIPSVKNVCYKCSPRKDHEKDNDGDQRRCDKEEAEEIELLQKRVELSSVLGRQSYCERLSRMMTATDSTWYYV